MYFLFSLQELSEPVHHVGFMLHEGVGIAVEGDGRVFVPEDLGERFHVHPAFKCAGGKRMPQGMKTFVRNIQLFQEQFKTSLVGVFFMPLKIGSNCFGSGITRREVAVFGSSMTSPPLPSWQDFETVRIPFTKSMSLHCKAISSPMRKPLYRQSRMPYSLSFFPFRTACSICFCSTRVKHSTGFSVSFGRLSLSAVYSFVKPNRCAVFSEL